ncbi:hypothetical protein EX30DRAFT_87794 [Ascodesmis nigricans]|uniref:Uncharacterized protein n=1 Tax=Ascodesmis nigricans TaxID=341454 RepID=A0A4S2N362_9PEZI|nr:hypothetical protein EX30DRAFT_87794 [Ascodesmis nigricans]
MFGGTGIVSATLVTICGAILITWDVLVTKMEAAQPYRCGCGMQLSCATGHECAMETLERALPRFPWCDVGRRRRDAPRTRAARANAEKEFSAVHSGCREPSVTVRIDHGAAKPTTVFMENSFGPFPQGEELAMLRHTL